MSERLTNILGYLTLIAILAAIWVMFGEDPNREQGGRGEATFSGLETAINDAAAVRITSGDMSTFLNKVDGKWFVIQRDGYAADTEMVRDFLRGIALSERRQPKTDNKDRFHHLGLAETALDIKVLDGDDRPLAAFLMGERKDSANGRSLTYIFQESDTRSWLVTGLADASADPAWWLDHSLFTITESRFAEITYADITIERALGAQKYTIKDLQDGEKAQADWQLRDPARLLSELTFDDVRKVANPLAEPLQRVTAKTYDGLTLTLTLFEMEGGTWAQVAASYTPDEGEGGMLPDAPADGEGEATDIAESTHGWLFLLSDYDAGVLKRTRKDFLMEKTAE
ncbi:DUF4340 domain-containing protein [Kordiimonas sp.]|uniref:DUF4340 domain-containing protein n=1 Tax=Kordiimonas sp. TaxID=1970157 RepID=UPI003A933A57